jgi:hypothetical protein
MPSQIKELCLDQQTERKGINSLMKSSIRTLVRKFLLEESIKKEVKIESKDEILNLISSVGLSSKGYNILSVKELEESFPGAIHLKISLQHAKPDFGRFIDELLDGSNRKKTIYRDTPKSKTQIARWLTGYKSDPDERQKSAAIKVAQLAGLDALQLIFDRIESEYQAECVANFVEASTQKKGQSIFELFIFPTDSGSADAIEAPPQPEVISVDNEKVVIPEPEVVPLTRKKKRVPKGSKLTSKEKKRGYTHKSAGRLRHILDEDQLESIADHAVNIVLGGKAQVDDELDPQEAHDMYAEVKRASDQTNKHDWPHAFYRVVDDYYDDPLPILKFHSGKVYVGGKIRSRSMMTQYQSRGEHHRNEPQNAFQGGSGLDFTPKKAGSKSMKDARRHISATRTSDEIIMYAKIERNTNRYTGKRSEHTGDITLYVFLIDRNFE